MLQSVSYNRLGSKIDALDLGCLFDPNKAKLRKHTVSSRVGPLLRCRGQVRSETTPQMNALARVHFTEGNLWKRRSDVRERLSDFTAVQGVALVTALPGAASAVKAPICLNN